MHGLLLSLYSRMLQASISPAPILAESEEQGAEAEVLAKNDEKNGNEDKQYARGQTEGEGLAKEEDADEDSGDGFECAHDGRWCRTYVVDGKDHEHEGEHGGEYRHPETHEPVPRRVEHHQMIFRTDKRPSHNGQRADEQHIESELHGRHAQRTLVDNDDIEGVSERGEQNEDYAHQTQCGLAVAAIEQRYAHER